MGTLTQRIEAATAQLEESVTNIAAAVDAAEAAAETAASYQAKIQVTNIAALKALNVAGFNNGDIATVRGYYSSGDLGGGSFYYDPTSSAVVDDGLVFAPTVGSGRWIRILNGYSSVTPQIFGAYGDGSHDDREALQKLIDAITTSKIKVSVKAIGKFKVSSRLIITDGFRSKFQGVNTGYDSPATVFIVDSVSEPLFELRSVVHCAFSDFSVYFKRPSSNTITTSDTAYCFLVKGWLYFSRIENIDCFFSAGFIRCIGDASYNSGESLMFSCVVNSIRSSFGRIGIEIGPGLSSGGGSGTTFSDVYLSNGGTDYSVQTPALCAVSYGTSAVNDEWERLNVEWTRFSGNVINLSGQIHFASPHFEGLSFSADNAEHSFYSIQNTGYSDISITNGIVQSSGIVFNVSGVTRVNIFESKGGFANGTLTVNNFEIYNLTTTVGTEIHRLRVARGLRFTAIGMREMETVFATNSVNWDCMSDLTSDLAKTVTIDDHFTSGIATFIPKITAYGSTDTFTNERMFGQWSLSRNLAAPIPDLVTDPFSPNKRVGVLRLQSGTAQWTKNVLSLPSGKIKVGQGPISIKAGIALSRFATGGITDNYTFGIGLAEDPNNLYGKAIMIWVAPYFNNQAINVGIRNSPTNATDSGFSGGALSTANSWEDFEILLNPDASAISYWVSSRDGRRQSSGGYSTGNIIPVGTTLTPFIYMEKTGSAAATNDTAYVDYFSVRYQPVGISGV